MSEFMQKITRTFSENSPYLEGKKELDGRYGQLFEPSVFKCNFVDIQDDFYLFLNLFKNSNKLIVLFMQQIATAIHFLSTTHKAHGNLNLNAVFFPVFKGLLQAEGQIKIGGLSACISLKNKE